jgi:hypothetical protein
VKYEPLSTIVANTAGLTSSSNFNELSTLQKIQIMNSAQQLICSYFNKKGRDNYLTDTSEGA